MGVRLSHLVADRKSVDVAVGEDQTVSVQYRPGAMTPATEDRLHKLIEEKRAGALLVGMLTDLLAGWDLLDEQDKPLPVTPESLQTIPMAFLAQVVQAITADMAPKEKKAETSAAG